ncbi:MAG: hypothetical protein ACI9W4_002288 [Rhodothermales bacterium]|jgi:hypothetical protein
MNPYLLWLRSGVRTALGCGSLALLLAATTPGSTNAQAPAESTIRVSAGTHLRATAGRSVGQDQDRIGFGIRRARIRFDARLQGGPSLFAQLAGGAGSVSLLDFYATYQVTPALRVRAGRMVSAQPRAFVMTSMFQIDGTDRPAVAEQWGRTTIGADGRDFGIDARLVSGPVEVVLFVHNGDGSWDRTRGNYRESVSGGNATRSVERTAIAVTGAVTFRPAFLQGLELGGFSGYNPADNPNTAVGDRGRAYITYGGHAYFGANPGSKRFRAKADLIAITYESLPGVNVQNSLGISLFGAVGLTRESELYARAESLQQDSRSEDDPGGYFAAGLSFSPSAGRGQPYQRERITLEYGRFKGGELNAESENLLIVQLQLAF